VLFEDEAPTVNAVPHLWIVVVNYNGLEDTRKCLRSLGAAGDPAPHVVLVDNASAQDPIAALRAEFPWVHYVRNPVNEGWAGGNNVGVRYALDRGADYVLLLNNDTVVSPRLVGTLLGTAAAHPDFGILGPVINFMDEPGKVMTDGCVFNRPDSWGFFERKPVPPASADTPAVTEVDIVNGCAMMVSRRVFDRIGLIDERFFLIHEESDFCLRAQHAGFRCGVLGEVLVWHKGSSTFNRTGRGTQRYYDARNLCLLLRKHRRNPAGRRGAWRSCVEYVKYVYYRYAIEREHGQTEAADAVLQGLCDAATGRYGPFARRRRTALPLLRGVFEFWRRRRAQTVAKV
jgi:GT2 family glycosyltransferase